MLPRVSSGLHYARDLLLACLTIAAVVSVPKSYNDIAGKPDSEQWYSAVHHELLNMERMQVWSVVSYNDVSPGTRTVSCHFVLDVKRALDGSISRKARLCADGSREVLPEGLSAFSSTSRPQTFRAFCSKAAYHKLRIHHFDIKSAFLEALQDVPVHMRPPPGVNFPPGSVLKLNRASQA